MCPKHESTIMKHCVWKHRLDKPVVVALSFSWNDFTNHEEELIYLINRITTLFEQANYEQ